MAAPRRPSSTVASDEKIAQALQEEFDSEAAQAADAGNGVIPAMDQLQVEVLAQALRGLSVGSSALTGLSRKSQVAQSEKKVSSSDGRVSASSSSLSGFPLRKSTSTVEGDHQLALALSEEYPQVDEELARRLHDLDSIPHIPKVNGAIPPVEAANADHQRLLDRLSLYGLTERRIAGDGNCQFRALSDQLYRTPEHHMFVRDRIVSQLTKSGDSYSGYVPKTYDEYLKSMAKDGEWGDHVTLQAAADYVNDLFLLSGSYCNFYFALLSRLETTAISNLLRSENFLDHILQSYLLCRDYALGAEVHSRNILELLGGGSLQFFISPRRVTRSIRELGRVLRRCQQILETHLRTWCKGHLKLNVTDWSGGNYSPSSTLTITA